LDNKFAADYRISVVYVYIFVSSEPLLTGDHLFESLDRQSIYVGVLISLWRFLFAAQPKELFFLAGLKKLEQRSHKCVELRGEYVE
jgi:hypothetical protein